MKLAVLEHEGLRVITTGQLAEVYGTEAKQISNNYNNNRERFQEGKHFFILKGDELKKFKGIHMKYENLKFTSKLYLWTERGANRHCKILDTDRAWEQYENLEDVYFRVKEGQAIIENMSSELKSILMLDKRQQEIEIRITSLEDNMTIDYGQQYTLRTIANKAVLKCLGGKDAPAYKQVGKKVFSSLWREYKRAFEVNSYVNTLVKDFDDSKDFLKKWEPTGDLRLIIAGANAIGKKGKASKKA